MRNLLLTFYRFKIFKRLVPSILRRLPRNKSINTKLNTFHMNLNLSSSIDREIFLKGFYDSEQINFIEKKIDLRDFDYF